MIAQGILAIYGLGPGVEAFSTTRQFPRAGHRQMLERFGIAPENVAAVKQVHGSEVAQIRSAEAKPSVAFEADGLMTDVPGLVLSVLTADCLPVFFFDPGGPAVGIAHAGWRGLRAGILEKTVALLRRNFDGRFETMRAAFGPAIRKCCYEVGSEFADYFPQSFSSGPIPGKGMMDLSSEARARLEAAGLLPGHISDSSICTACQDSQFFSARRGDAAERIFSFIRIS